MRILILCLWVAVWPAQTFAQVPFNFPKSLSTAETSVADERRWSGFHNPAALAHEALPRIQALVHSYIHITALNTKSLSVSYPFQWANTGLAISSFGFQYYNETHVGLAFARNFADRLSMGLQFNYFSLYNMAVDSRMGILFPQTGITVRIAPTLVLGVHTFNPFQASLRSVILTKRVPSIFSTGISKNFSSNFILRLQADKELQSPYRTAMAFEYWPLPEWNFRLGFYNQQVLVPCFGFHIQLRSFSVDFGAELHPILGVNTLLGVAFCLKSHSKP